MPRFCENKITKCLWTSLQISNPISVVKKSWYALLIQTKYLQFLEMRWLPMLPATCPTCAGPLGTCSIRGRVDASVAIGFQLPAATIGGDASKQRQKNPWSHWHATERCGWSEGIFLFGTVEHKNILKPPMIMIRNHILVWFNELEMVGWLVVPLF